VKDTQNIKSQLKSRRDNYKKSNKVFLKLALCSLNFHRVTSTLSKKQLIWFLPPDEH